MTQLHASASNCLPSCSATQYSDGLSPGRNSTTLENAGETDVSDAVGAVLGAANESDLLLRELIAIWGEVSPEIRQAILTIVRQGRAGSIEKG